MNLKRNLWLSAAIALAAVGALVIAGSHRASAAQPR